ncbi:MAG: carboxypeptidase regulatory-like domain-containing protein, partial [Thermoanaerobaculia bacterium]
SSPGVLADAIFSAVTLPAPAAAIDVLSGNDQRGGVGTELALPLVAVLTDGNANPVAGAPVTFHVTRGGGGFGGADTLEVTTDASGLASARLTLGPAAGFDDNWIEASFPGMSVLPAAFKASGFVLGGPAATAVSGVILDNQGTPVPGVTLRLRDSSLMTTSDAQGQFRLTGVPVGRIFLIADASTANLPGSWASLEYELFTLAGVDNTLVRPVYILPLDLAHGVAVDETHGGRVTLPDVPGFALEVAPGSVTFPGGSRSGTISVTAVHADKIPMAPGGGMQPRLIVTIQPAGARFDPPAAITFPNVDGLPPGSVTELFSFDHDLGAFVAIGTGTVSEDGLLLRSDPGFGVVQAGWHCGAPPSGNGDSETLTVSILNEKPVILCPGDGGKGTQQISALGTPGTDVHYGWEISSGAVTLSPVGGNLCHNQPICSTQATANLLVGDGKATARVSLVCELTGAAALDETEIDIPAVAVQSVDLCGNEIVTHLAPESLSGTFTLSAVTAGGGETVILSEDRDGGTYSDEMDIAQLPEGTEFTAIRAKWKVKGCERKNDKAAHFKSLGSIHYTTYNYPSAEDPTCSGGNVPVCFSTSSCTYTTGTAPGPWVTQVTGPNHNGGREATGSGEVGGIFVQREEYCLNHSHVPAACTGVAILRSNSNAGTCGRGLGQGDVAVGNLNTLPCGTQLCLNPGASPTTKTVADHCGACSGDAHHIDSFSTDTRCHITDEMPGMIPTLQIYNN